MMSAPYSYSMLLISYEAKRFKEHVIAQIQIGKVICRTGQIPEFKTFAHVKGREGISESAVIVIDAGIKDLQVRIMAQIYVGQVIVIAIQIDQCRIVAYVEPGHAT